MVAESGSKVPFALHLDHGDSFELCKSCVESGFSSIMIDASHLPFEENISLTKRVVEFCREQQVTVEGELGVLAGIEDEVVAEKSTYTNPDQVEEFVARTGVDSLAISIGTSHGAYKFTPGPEGSIPPLRFDILEECAKRLPDFPIVLHGASSVVQEYVKTINEFGGDLKGAVGVPEDQLRHRPAAARAEERSGTGQRRRPLAHETRQLEDRLRHAVERHRPVRSRDARDHPLDQLRFRGRLVEEVRIGHEKTVQGGRLNAQTLAQVRIGGRFNKGIINTEPGHCR